MDGLVRRGGARVSQEPKWVRRRSFPTRLDARPVGEQSDWKRAG